MPISRRHLLMSAAATAAVAAMPAASAIAAVEEAPACLLGWAFVVNDATRSLLSRLPNDLSSDDDDDLLSLLFDETYQTRNVAGPHRWVGVAIVDGKLTVVGCVTWSRRQAQIDVGWQLEAMS